MPKPKRSWSAFIISICIPVAATVVIFPWLLGDDVIVISRNGYDIGTSVTEVMLKWNNPPPTENRAGPFSITLIPGDRTVSPDAMAAFADDIEAIHAVPMNPGLPPIKWHAQTSIQAWDQGSDCRIPDTPGSFHVALASADSVRAAIYDALSGMTALFSGAAVASRSAPRTAQRAKQLLSGEYRTIGCAIVSCTDNTQHLYVLTCQYGQ